MAILKTRNPDSATPDRPNQVTSTTVDGREAIDTIQRNENGDVINSNYALIATYTGTTTSTKTVTGKAVGIWNRGNTDLTLTINTIDVVIEPDVILGPELLNFGSFTSVLVTATGAWQLFIYE